MRELLTNLGVNVLASQIALRAAHHEFGPDGTLEKEASQGKVDRLAGELAQILRV